MEKDFTHSSGLLQRASLNGLSLGLYFIVLAGIVALSQAFGPAVVLLWGIIVALPFYLYGLLRRSYGLSKFSRTYFQLVLEGLLSFVLGAAVQALVVFVFIKFVMPDYISDTYNSAVEAARALGTAEGAQLAAMLEQLQEQAGLPTPAQLAASTINLYIFTGFWLSVIVSGVLVWRYRDNDRRERLLNMIEHPLGGNFPPRI